MAYERAFSAGNGAKNGPTVGERAGSTGQFLGSVAMNAIESASTQAYSW